MSKVAPETSERILACEDCLLPLPLRTARRGEVDAAWECRSCGARVHGVIAEDRPKKLRRNVRRCSQR
ncbi:hypothetical protein [Symmachiella dynata]|uniref:hypothetical protein n=1 Tax=Symmachiella dynata TaxID=2527995 RepID=UPI0030EBFF40